MSVSIANWKAQVRARIRKTDLTIVICGEHTHTAKGVAAELTITQELGKPYFLLRGRPNKTCHKPTMARSSDQNVQVELGQSEET